MTPPLPDTPAGIAVVIAHAQAAEREGRRDDAVALYEEALHGLRGAQNAPLACSLLRWVARCRLESMDLDAAHDAATVAIAVAEAAGDALSMAHSMNVMGNVLRTRGSLDEAHTLYLQARDVASRAGEATLTAMIDQNLGVLSNIRGDYKGALKRYRASLAAYRALGENHYAAGALSNLGMLYTDQRRWRAAERAYAEALDICTRLDDAGTRLRVENNRVELLTAQERWAEAGTACRAALALALEMGDPFGQAESHKHLGVIARETGDWAAADEHLATAARIAEERGELLLRAETARELAALHWLRQRNRETLQQLNLAHRLFTRLEARRDLSDVSARLHDLETMFLSIVTMWGQSIESADHYTQGHCERVADRACALASAVGFDDGTLLWFRMGALLHDVGKIVVPPAILNKPGPLTPEERAVMERHPDAGVELINDLEFPWDVRPMVRHHHEAWDGSGYPARLSGEDIPLSARILCVADVYDALATDRPYRKAFPHEHTLRIMQADAGHIFDPTLFSVFREVVGGGIVTAAASPV
ncbi:HD domain-containing phosphohydrolase [Longimicrobium sp.]|uniref:HD domain-containing phosphohydrolase n=1 Tax=Longimicrobium sp. TaxID=2029185 RepID=UPI003B3A753B